MSPKNEDIDLSRLKNSSILIIDDNHSLHRDYQSVLRPDQRDEDEKKLDELEAVLLGASYSEENQSRLRNFTLQSAYQGEEAYELVKKHKEKGIRYPLAFIDMRMPPGWDGLETILKIRQIDPFINFVIVTAYSDHTEEDLDKRLGGGTPVVVMYKPFDPAEIYRLSYKIVSEWNAKHAE